MFGSPRLTTTAALLLAGALAGCAAGGLPSQSVGYSTQSLDRASLYEKPEAIPTHLVQLYDQRFVTKCDDLTSTFQKHQCNARELWDIEHATDSPGETGQ